MMIKKSLPPLDFFLPTLGILTNKFAVGQTLQSKAKSIKLKWELFQILHRKTIVMILILTWPNPSSSPLPSDEARGWVQFPSDSVEKNSS